jgi:O-antigen/teichoic acid export membrane protein
MHQSHTELSSQAALQPLDTHGFGKIFLRAGMVALGSHVVGQLIRFCGNLILTRLLAPEAFGVMLVANVVWVGLTLLTDFGFRQVVIRSPNAANPQFLNTVWTLQILQGLFISALLLAAAGAMHVAGSTGIIPGGRTVASPELPWVIGWLSVVALLSSAESTKMHMASRNLQISRIAVIEIGSQLIALSVTLALAIRTGGVEALVAGACVSTACRTAATHLLLHGHSNRFRFDKAAVQEVVSFGAPIVLTSCLGFLVLNGDKLVLGWVLPAPAMGAYAIAVLLISAFVDACGKLMSQVAFPAINSAVARNPGALRDSYLHVRSRIDTACVAAAGLLGGCGDRIVAILYDSRYAEAGSYLSILALSLLGIRYRLLSQVFLVIGRPRLTLYEQVSQILALVVGIILGFRFFGTTGAVWGVALSYLFAQIWNVALLQPKLGLLSLRLELRGAVIFAVTFGLARLIRLWI